jgi:uncharacterized membrane protein YtjA (UPF0391 family)
MILIVAVVLSAISILLRLITYKMTLQGASRSLSRAQVRLRFWISISIVGVLSGAIGYVAFAHSSGGVARIGFFLPFIAIILAALFYGRDLW